MSTKENIKTVAKKIKGKVKKVAVLFETDHYVRLANKIKSQYNKQYLFSIVIAVYNAGKFINDAFNSIKNQTVGFNNIQVILVNDGSSDNSGIICDELAGVFQNVVFIEEENSGVSAARNLGLSQCEGLYIGFLDADDKLSNNWCFEVLKAAKLYPDAKVFAGKTRFFGSKGGNHPLNYICSKDAVIDLNKTYDYYPLSATRSFFRFDAIEGHHFNESVKYTEDSLIVHEIQLDSDNPSFVALSKPLYYYRKHGSSASDTSTKQECWYIDTLQNSHQAIFTLANEKMGYIPQYIQYAVMYDLCWRIKTALPEDMPEEFARIYLNGIRSLLQQIDDEVILAVRGFDFCLKMDALAFKYGKKTDEMLEDLETCQTGLILSDRCDEDKATMIKNFGGFSKIVIDIVSLSKDGASLELEGRIPLLRLLDSQVSLDFCVGEDRYRASIFPHPHNIQDTVFEKGGLKPQLCFRVSVPMSPGEVIVAPHLSVGGGTERVCPIEFGKFGKINSTYLWTSYAIIGSECLIHLVGNSTQFAIVYGELTDEIVSHYEDKYQEALRADKEGKKWIRLRNAFFQYKKEHPEEKIWVITDRVTSAEDSGEVMFRYLIEHAPSNIRPIFVIRRDAPDYNRLKEIGEVVPAGSPAHYRAVLFADKVVSSAADEWVINPYGNGVKYIKDLLNFDFIFLQHGVIKDSLASWLYRANKNIKLFVTSAPRERQSIIDGGYGYTEDQVILTGLPRWDSYKIGSNHAQRIIYLMPTWRQYLSAGYNWNASSLAKTSSSVSDFSCSEYYKFYQSVLNDQTLHDLLERYDYILRFAPHPRTSIESFIPSNRVEILRPESFSYSEAFNEMSMLITDYSSVAFNIAIMNKPVIYCQFDKEEFYAGHTGAKDYYSYEEDGFGPIVETKDQLVSLIGQYMSSGMRVEDKYAERIKEFFFWPPEGVSRAELVYREIMRLDQS